MLQHMEAITAYVLSLGLATALLLVWLVHRQRTSGGFSLWLASGVAGVLLGAAGSYAVLSAAGFKVTKVEKIMPASSANSATSAPSAPAGMGSQPGGAGGGPAGGMGGGGMGGGGRGPNPKRDLTSLVRKLNLLTDDISIKLNPDQAAALVKGLAGVDEAEKFSEDEAKAMQEELMAVLNDDQKTKLESIGLPFGGRGGGGGGGGMGGGAAPDPNANPFHQEANLNALKSFRGKFQDGPSSSAEPSEK